MKLIKQNDVLQAHPEFLNEQIDDHDKAIYAKGWNDCNKEYYNAITELPVASMACTDLSMRLRRTFEADELVNQRILLDAADAIEELLAKDTNVPNKWISVEERLPEDSGYAIVFCADGNLRHVTFAKYLKTPKRWELSGARSYWRVLNWMPLPEPPKGD